MANEKNEDIIVIPVGKYLSAVRSNPWIVVSIILFIALIAVFIWKSSPSSDNDLTGKSGFVTEKEATDNLLNFISKQGRGNAKLISVKSVGPYYEAMIKFENQQLPAHITKDGNFLVLNSIPLTSNAPKLAEALPPEQNKPIDIDIAGSPSRGSKDAKVMVVEFMDFECQFCKKFLEESYQSFMEDYVKKGKVLYVIKDFPLDKHPNAQKAAEAARCVREQKGDEGYFKMHEKLFENQDNLTVENIIKISRQLGVMGAKFESCLKDGKYEEDVKKDLEFGKQIGITGTPSFVINGKLISGAVPYDALKQLIEQELGP